MTRVLLSFDNVVFICYCDSWGINVLVLWSRTAWLVLVEFCSEQLGVRYISSHYSLLEEKLITSLPILQNMVISDRYYRICSLIVRSGNFNSERLYDFVCTANATTAAATVPRVCHLSVYVCFVEIQPN